MDQVFIRDNYLYLEFDYYSVTNGYGYKHEIEKVAIDQVNYILVRIGPKGGFLGWDIIGYEKSPVNYNGKPLEFRILTSFGRKQRSLLDKTREVLSPLGVKFIEEVYQYGSSF